MKPSKSTKSRHHAREVALQILYRHDLKGKPAPESEHALAAELNNHFEHFQVPSEVREFAAELAAGTLRGMTALDELIEKHAANWKVSRMAIVDRALLRMAVYEMKRFPDTSPSIIIDEAIELAKQFGTADTPAFVNGILDTIKGELATSAAGT